MCYRCGKSVEEQFTGAGTKILSQHGEVGKAALMNKSLPADGKAQGVAAAAPKSCKPDGTLCVSRGYSPSCQNDCCNGFDPATREPCHATPVSGLMCYRCGKSVEQQITGTQTLSQHSGFGKGLLMNSSAV